jgi:hypothetical protein
VDMREATEPHLITKMNSHSNFNFGIVRAVETRFEHILPVEAIKIIDLLVPIRSNLEPIKINADKL